MVWSLILMSNFFRTFSKHLRTSEQIKKQIIIFFFNTNLIFWWNFVYLAGISKSPLSSCVSFTRLYSCLCIYHLVVWSNLTQFRWNTFPSNHSLSCIHFVLACFIHICAICRGPHLTRECGTRPFYCGSVYRLPPTKPTRILLSRGAVSECRLRSRST